MDLDWRHVQHSLRRQLEKHGIPAGELADRCQDAAAMLWRDLSRNPQLSLGLAIWRAAGDAARGQTAHRTVPVHYVDAISPYDQRERARIDGKRRENFARRAALAQMDLDL